MVSVVRKLFKTCFISSLLLCLSTNLFSQETLRVLPDSVTFIKLKKRFYCDQPESENHFHLKNENAPLGRKWVRGEGIIGGVEFGMMGILMLLPRSYTHWPPNFLQDGLKNIKRAFTTPPVWDKDDFVMNYFNHPYSGAIYYNALRSQGATKWQSFVYSAAQSAFWEYVIEGVAERPSIQDIIVTPVGGYLIGELTNKATTRMRKNGFTFIEKIIVFLINPMYVYNNGYRSLKPIP